jgi:hypothetical protein
MDTDEHGFSEMIFVVSLFLADSPFGGRFDVQKNSSSSVFICVHPWLKLPLTASFRHWEGGNAPSVSTNQRAPIVHILGRITQNWNESNAPTNLKPSPTKILSGAGTIRFQPRMNTDEHGFAEMIYLWFRSPWQTYHLVVGLTFRKYLFHPCSSVFIRG